MNGFYIGRNGRGALTLWVYSSSYVAVPTINAKQNELTCMSISGCRVPNFFDSLHGLGGV